MYLMIDHYDSFVYNLCVYMRELGEEVLVIRHDRAARETVGSLMESACLSGIILSPGPGTPDSCAASCRIVKEFAGRIPMVAEITGTLKEGEDVMSLMEAAFPGGSITGAPKRRAMEIIDELEQGKRGLYTGSVGYLSLDGRCDFNIVIRTLVHTGDCYHLGVGGGITCESESEFEYEETLQKAKALIEALRLA